MICRPFIFVQEQHKFIKVHMCVCLYWKKINHNKHSLRTSLDVLCSFALQVQKVLINDY